jgi:hypothetical protein
MAGVRITQLHPQHATGRRYGSFAGKAAAAAAVTLRKHTGLLRDVARVGKFSVLLACLIAFPT